MAGGGRGPTVAEDRTAGAEAPSALRINTDVFTTLTATAGEDGDTPIIVGWFDCWRP